MGNDYRNLLDDNCNGIIAVCDKKIRNDIVKNGIEYITVNTLLNKYRDIPIYVTSTKCGSVIRDELCEKGISANHIVLNNTPLKEVDYLLSQVKVVKLVDSDLGHKYM